MTSAELTGSLLRGLILYGLLPLWIAAWWLDCWCHYKTDIEHNSGLKETFLHALMGILVFVPIWLALTWRINVMVLLVSCIVLIAHEITAHMDILYAKSCRREISVWEHHAHAWLSTIPWFIFSLMLVINWTTWQELVHFNWEGQLSLQSKEETLGHSNYKRDFFIVAFFLGYLPYLHEGVRCWKNRGKSTGPVA